MNDATRKRLEAAGWRFVSGAPDECLWFTDGRKITSLAGAFTPKALAALRAFIEAFEQEERK